MATTELSGQTYPTAAHVRILFLSLISYLNSQNDPNHLLSDMIDKIKYHNHNHRYKYKLILECHIF